MLLKALSVKPAFSQDMTQQIWETRAGRAGAGFLLRKVIDAEHHGFNGNEKDE